MFKLAKLTIGPQCIREIHITHANRIKDYYNTLGVRRTATADQIKTAYYTKAKTHHPDANKDNPAAAIKFQEISEAYEILSDTSKRRIYDRETGPVSFYGESKSKPTSTTSRPAPRSQPGEPISMNHIQHVYKTLNKDDPGEMKFRPFEDHHYDGTQFNRFYYIRRWDPEARMWKYKERPKREREAYHAKLDVKQFQLRLLLTICAFSALGVALFGR